MPGDTNAEYTVAQRLAEVNQAIQAVMLGGQSYKIGSRSLTRADLSTLRSMRNELESMLAADEQTPLFSDVYVAFFEGR